MDDVWKGLTPQERARFERLQRKYPCEACLHHATPRCRMGFDVETYGCLVRTHWWKPKEDLHG